MDRRSFLKGLGVTAGAAMTSAVAPAAAVAARRSEGDGLGVRAAQAGYLYGCAVKNSLLLRDPAYERAIRREAGVLVHEYELKRETLQPYPNRWNFKPADVVFDYAARNNMKVRGHTFVWHRANPKWLLSELASNPQERLITDHVALIGTRYRGRVQSWDVVNEVIEPEEGDANGLRVSSPWYKAFGESYIDMAFHAARAADPHGLLFACDYGTEMHSNWHLRRRTAVLKLLERLKSRNVPVEGFAMQAHLNLGTAPFDERSYAKFLEDLADLGMRVMITELDIDDRRSTASQAGRDVEVAALTKAVLDVAFDSPAMIGLLSWGLTDRYSNLATKPVAGQGEAPRGLPLDRNYVRKPMWQAIDGCLESRIA